MLAPWKKSYDKPRQQKHHFADKDLYSQSYVRDSDCLRIPLLWYSKRKILSTFSTNSRRFLPKVKSIHLHDIFRAEHKSYRRHCPASNLCSRGKSVNQSGLTLCNPMDCNLPDSSVHGIFQTRILKWVAISSFRGSSLGSNPGLPHYRQIPYCLSHQRKFLR